MNISTRRGESINSAFGFILGYHLCYLPTKQKYYQLKEIDERDSQNRDIVRENTGNIFTMPLCNSNSPRDFAAGSEQTFLLLLCCNKKGKCTCWHLDLHELSSSQTND